MKIGLFLGSFNPIHMGHLIIANTMAYTTDLEEVWLIPAPPSPFRNRKTTLPKSARIEMINMSISDNPRLKVFDFISSSPTVFTMLKPSYIVDNLNKLSDKFPEHEFKLIIGEDALVKFKKWNVFNKVLEKYEIYVSPKNNTPDSNFKKHPKVKFIEVPLILDISGTYIRNAIKNRHPINYLVPSVVEEYISRNEFFI
ncbi:nicotinate-nucleotide adenylyltransferase [Flavobacterium araucananum]|uniref:Probable nicotinate-nucleotide adenylyltransferase n=1 Tax=Flavobacterium araucananum TaxID=946678 RepID=A0A227P3Q1_9FLAO|nr:nicotinate (nicotinamide) nucleotide adenylyltransferase [Flavobacterium araucananum]OXG03675.1 nicotinic acid mononucleotide adenylyltransferase [Flavobacterium araucananum]PWJ96740.1 nicotinate-nucleotide adenylyltransferase [Flavobacterium araucananum]